MSESKFIIYVYKITSKQDKFKLFIGSTKQKIKTLFSFFLKDIEKNKNHPNNLYKWIQKLDKTFLKIKLLKAYPVNTKEEQRDKEKKWVKKYENDGYEVIHNPFAVKENKTNKLYVCFQGISLEELVSRYGSNILSISTEPHKNSDVIPPVPNIPTNLPPLDLSPPNVIIPKITSSLKSIPKLKKIQKEEKLLPINEGGYMNELKNLLVKRRNSSLGITDLVNNNLTKKIKKKKIKQIPIKNNKPINFVEELKMKMKPLY